MSKKPSGVAASQAETTGIEYAMQMAEGFPAKQIQWEQWETFYVREDRDRQSGLVTRWLIGDRRRPIENPFHFVASFTSEDAAFRQCLQWNRGPQ